MLTTYYVQPLALASEISFTLHYCSIPKVLTEETVAERLRHLPKVAPAERQSWG